MKILRLAAILLATIALALMAETPASGNEEDPQQEPFARMSGAELAQRLTDEASRPRAFYELWRRAFPTRDHGFTRFSEYHFDPQVVVCPQGEGSPPIYLLLSGSLPRSTDRDAYVVPNPDELFRSIPPPGLWKHEGRPTIEAFDGGGRPLEPFGGDNVLEGQLVDINGDGFIERIETTHLFVEGINAAHVLTVQVVRPKADPLFALVLNWGANEWGYRLSDMERSGVRAIEIGPRTREGIKPKAVFQWDPSRHTFVGPTGVHFRVLDHAPDRDELSRLKASDFQFPTDPDALTGVPPADHDERPDGSIASRPPPANAYHAGTLAALSDSELLRYMGRGRSAWDFENEHRAQNRLPDGFWNNDAKAAALALAEANRSESHRNQYLLALDDRDGNAAPATCSIAFSYTSALCYNAVSSCYFLRVDPKESYLAYAREWSGGAVFYNLVHDQPAFDLRFCPLPYQDARRVAEVIWWLDRVRSHDASAAASDWTFAVSRRILSTADGHDILVLRDAGGRPLLSREGRQWADRLPARWLGEYDRETFVNFAEFLITEALPKRLGTAWAQYEPKHRQDMLARGTDAPQYTEQEIAHLREVVRKMLELYTPGQQRISFRILGMAAQAGGALPVPGAASRLRAIEAALPSAPHLRSFEEIWTDQDRLRDEIYRDPKSIGPLRERSEALDAELCAIWGDEGPNGLRRVLDVAQRQLALAEDAPRLEAWARSNEDGSQWALQRLAAVDRGRYGATLVAWMNEAKPKGVQQLFDELVKVDPARAASIARNPPAGLAGPLAVPGFSLLRERNELTDEPGRVQAMIGILGDPKQGWEEKLGVIDALVPDDVPLRFPAREIDDALVQLVDPSHAPAEGNYALGAACRALARRGRIEQFDHIATTLGAIKDPMTYMECFAAMTQLAEVDPVRFNPRLVTIIRPHLARTNVNMTELLWTVWSADLRELKTEVERLATAGPDDYEDRKGSSWGGPVAPVEGRFHLARKIASVWNEPDAPTRVRLLVGLLAGEPNEALGESRARRIQIELDRAAGGLTKPQRAQIAHFLRSIEETPATEDQDTGTRQKALSFARSALGL